MKKKPLTFILHFNRFNARKASKDAWTIHLSKKCIFAPKVEVRVPVETIYKGDSAPQPRAFLKGKGIITIKKDRTVVIE